MNPKECPFFSRCQVLVGEISGINTALEGLEKTINGIPTTVARLQAQMEFLLEKQEELSREIKKLSEFRNKIIGGAVLLSCLASVGISILSKLL